MASSSRASVAHSQQGTPHEVKLSKEDMYMAWQMLSPSGRSVLTKSEVLDNLRTVLPNATAREVREMVGPGNMSIDKLDHLLFHAGAPAVDGNAEAFKILDPQGTGYIDANAIRQLLMQLPGMDQIDEADMKLVMQLCDADKDGRISLKDFATIGSWAPAREQETPATKQIMLQKLKEQQGVVRNDDD